MSQVETELGPAIGHIETDVFCEGCGYNLHTQAVMRDPRLGVLVCRCPECGRYGAAGRSTSAARTWLNRFGTALLVVWVLFLLGFFALCTLFLGVVAYGHTMDMTQWVPTGPVTTMPASGPFLPRYQYVIREIPANDTFELARARQESRILSTIAIVLGLIVGMVYSAFLWHAKGWRRLFAFLPPLVGCGAAAMIFANDPMTMQIRDWGVAHIAEYLPWECGAVGVGLLIGRPIARFALQILVPPKLRQHLSALWTVDGKRLSVLERVMQNRKN